MNVAFFFVWITCAQSLTFDAEAHHYVPYLSITI